MSRSPERQGEADDGVEALLASGNPGRKDFTVDEALAIADRHDSAHKHVPSVSRTLAAEVRRLRPTADGAMALARGAWRAGITLGNNICVQESYRENDQDGDSGWINGTAECAKRIREWVEPDDAQLLELLTEAGVDVSALTAALNPEAGRG